MIATIEVRRSVRYGLLSVILAGVLAACTAPQDAPNGDGEDPDPGTLQVTITGLDTNVDADVTVTGPDSFQQQLTASATLVGLTPGSYTVSAQSVTNNGGTFEPTIVNANATVPEGGTATSTVTYVIDADPGALQVTITGLDTDVDADVTVTGPGGFTAQLTESDTLSDLVPGTYSVSATSVQDGDQTFTATVSDPEVEVQEGATATTTVTYEVAPLEDDGDSEVNPGVWAQFRVTAGAPVWVDRMLFNEDDELDVKGIQLRNEIGEPDDPEDWLQFALVHGDAPTTTIQVSLECPVQLENGQDAATIIGRAEVLDLDGSLVDRILCDDTENVVITNEGGSTDHQIRVFAATTNPHYVRYELSVDAYCFQECNYQPFEP